MLKKTCENGLPTAPNHLQWSQEHRMNEATMENVSAEIPPAQVAADPGVALCFSASFLGFFTHAGFLCGLEKLGVRPGHLSGCSAGGYIAGLSAAGFSGEEILKVLLDKRMMNSFWEWKSPLRGCAMLANLRGITGMVSGRSAANYLRPILGDRRIEDCVSPTLSISVSDIMESRLEIVQSGPMVDFLVATCAIPGIFGAYPIDGKLYWDGALGDPVPILHFLEDPQIHTIIVHIIKTEPEIEARKSRKRLNVHHAANLAVQIISNRILEFSVEQAALKGKQLHIFESETPRPRFFAKPESRTKFIEAGRQTAAKNTSVLSSIAAS